MKPAGLILAGGRGSRMGAGVPKPLRLLAGRPLLLHVADRLRPACEPLWVNAAPGEGFEALGLPLVADRRPDFRGPLAGIEAGLTQLAAEGVATHLLVAAGDTPFLRADLAARLAERGGERPLVARHAGRLQPTVGLWPLTTLAGLSDWLDAGQPLAIRAFIEATGYDVLDFAGGANASEGDPFFNVNTPEDLEDAERRLARR
ncbi:molybdenum cofactor guanylyltransferase [Jiella sp. M17.18]|uniref:molybdenum cofactor guanylyltransferase n=1 Tax=Jiella sp. M17.18 TaxID=3234247 RepID=UPI0034DE3F9E